MVNDVKSVESDIVKQQAAPPLGVLKVQRA